MSLSLEPAQKLVFEKKEDEDGNFRYMSHLRLKTLHKNAVLFKVRTTKPNKYNVKPKQGVLLQGARLDAQFVLNDSFTEEIDEKLGNAQDGVYTVKDRFQVMGINLSPVMLHDLEHTPSTTRDVIVATMWKENEKAAKPFTLSMEFRKRERPSESPSKEVEEAGEGEAESGAGHDEEGQPGAEQQEAGGDDTMHTMWQEGGGEGDGSGYWHGQVAQGEDGAGGYSQEALWAALKETRDQLNELTGERDKLAAQKDSMAAQLITLNEELSRLRQKESGGDRETEAGLRRKVKELEDSLRKTREELNLLKEAESGRRKLLRHSDSESETEEGKEGLRKRKAGDESEEDEFGGSDEEEEKPKKPAQGGMTIWLFMLFVIIAFLAGRFLAPPAVAV